MVAEPKLTTGSLPLVVGQTHYPSAPVSLLTAISPPVGCLSWRGHHLPGRPSARHARLVRVY